MTDFPDQVVTQLLVESHRRCCVCHRFCGVKMEIDHIKQRADGGASDYANGIPVCFECHAEIHMYNDRHPRRRKFRPEELKAHREQWFRLCKDHPAVIVERAPETGVGPITSLIDELEFNKGVSERLGNQIGCGFEVRQFDRTISEGTFSMLPDDLKDALRNAYISMKRANAFVATRNLHLYSSPSSAQVFEAAQEAVQDASGSITRCHDMLLTYLQNRQDG